MSKPRLLISFSGGETSAYMTWRLLNIDHAQYGEIVVVFANTGQENEETLEFVNECDEAFGFGTVWIEAVQHPGERKRASFRVVSFETADRDGRVFEEMIRKYGIPNKAFPHCTRDLKLTPILSYAEALGWATGTYQTAIGIRADEIDRMSETAAEKGIIYPLVPLGIKKTHINQWFLGQPFRLRLKGYQGNCKWCWKKTFRKHLTLISENPRQYRFPRRMEALYGRIGPEIRRGLAADGTPLPADYRRTFFRGNRSTDDLFAMFEEAQGAFVPAVDDAQAIPEPDLFGNLDLDTPGGCGESCEVFADETDDALDEAA